MATRHPVWEGLGKWSANRLNENNPATSLETTEECRRIIWRD